ncbi:hypothetical protein PTKIN_Ptkin17bG0063900 [Pterospermum kingtungense]
MPAHRAIENACKISSTFDSKLTESDVADKCESFFDEDQELAICKRANLLYVYQFSSDISNGDREIILSGSFNPLHDGDLKLLEVATSFCGKGYPCFPLSSVTANKTPLLMADIIERVMQIEKVGKTVIISNQPYFYKKAEHFPGSASVIGADTAVRFINHKCYNGSYDRMIKDTHWLHLLVAGRKVDGAFKWSLEEMTHPPQPAPHPAAQVEPLASVWVAEALSLVAPPAQENMIAVMRKRAAKAAQNMKTTLLKS